MQAAAAVHAQLQAMPQMPQHLLHAVVTPRVDKKPRIDLLLFATVAGMLVEVAHRYRAAPHIDRGRPRLALKARHLQLKGPVVKKVKEIAGKLEEEKK